jgi:hypothetical protein
MPAACLRQLSIFFSCQFFAFFPRRIAKPGSAALRAMCLESLVFEAGKTSHSRVCNLAIAGGNAGPSSGWALNRETPLHGAGILWASLDPRVLVEVVLF